MTLPQVLKNHSLGLYEEVFNTNCVDGETLTVRHLTLFSNSFLCHVTNAPAESRHHLLPCPLTLPPSLLCLRTPR
jgi:hypothetical protein